MSAIADKHIRIAESWLESIGHGDHEPRVHFWNDTLWIYEDGKWHRTSDAGMTARVRKWCMTSDIPVNVNVVREATEDVKAITLLDVTATRLPFWAPSMPVWKGNTWLPMQNYLVDPEKLSAGNFQDAVDRRTSRWFSTMSLDYDYDAFACCPEWEAWLGDMLEKDTERINLLQEFFGYWLIPDTRQHAALFLVGEAACGKSTIIEVAKKFLGEENCSYLPIEAFAEQFSLQSTAGSYLNISDEVITLTKKAVSVLKWYIAGQPISCDVKGKSRLKLTPSARLLIAMNAWPNVPDNTDGIWRRIFVLPMRVEIPMIDRDTELPGRLSSERAGIFNWAIEGLRRLRSQGRFTEPRLSANEIAFAKQACQSNTVFVSERITSNPDGFISNADLKSQYDYWSESNGQKPMASLQDLQQSVSRLFKSALHARKTINKTVKRGFTGVAWK